MYLDSEIILYFIILPILGFIGMFFYTKQRERELYKMYSNKKEQYDKLYIEYAKLKKQTEK